MVKEIKAKPNMAAWRHDEGVGQSYALKLTAAGLKAIAVEDEGVSEEIAAAASKIDPQAKGTVAATHCAVVKAADRATSSEDAASVTVAAAPRLGSKLAEVVDLLRRNDGASIDELIAATDWLPHTTRAALTGLRKQGYAIERRREEDVTRYRLGAPEIHDANGPKRANGPSEPQGSARAVTRARPTKAASRAA